MSNYSHALGISYHLRGRVEADNGNVHRAAAKIIVSKSRAARGSACNVLLSTVAQSVGEHVISVSDVTTLEALYLLALQLRKQEKDL